MKITKEQIKQLIKEELENVLSEDDTLPPQGSPPKKRGFVDMITQTAIGIYDIIKGMFSGELERPEETFDEIHKKLKKESPHVQKILQRHALQRQENAKEMDKFLSKLTVAKLKPSEFPDVDFYDDDPLP